MSHPSLRLRRAALTLVAGTVLVATGPALTAQATAAANASASTSVSPSAATKAAVALPVSTTGGSPAPRVPQTNSVANPAPSDKSGLWGLLGLLGLIGLVNRRRKPKDA